MKLLHNHKYGRILCTAYIALFASTAYAEDIILYQKDAHPSATELSDILYGRQPTAHNPQRTRSFPNARSRNFDLDDAETFVDAPQDASTSTSTPQAAPTDSATTDSAAVMAAPAKSDTTPPVAAFGAAIQFDFNSARIKPESYAFLDTLAAAMNTPAADGNVVIIEGHTDASGDASYNMALSVQRAHAVKNYLTQVGRVQPQKLVLMGKGETELRTPNAPFAAENRRVQFRRQPH